MIRPTKKELEAIRITRHRYNKLIQYVRKTPSVELTSYTGKFDVAQTMIEALGLFPMDCAICIVSNNSCEHCITSRVDKACSIPGSVYYRANRCTTKKAFIKALMNIRDFNNHLKSWQ